MLTVASTYLKAAFDVCVAEGCAPDALAKTIPGGVSVFDDPLLRVRCEVLIDLLSEAEHLLGQTGIGLKLGLSFRPSTFLDFGFGLFSCDNLRHALQFNRTYQAVNQQIGRAELKEGRNLAFVEWVSPFEAEYVRPATEAILTGYLMLGIRMTWSDGYESRRMRFRHKKPAHAAAVEQLFDCEVLYEEPLDILEFNPELVDKPMPARNPALVETLSRRLDIVLQSIEQPDSTTLATYRLLERNLNEGSLSITDIARSLGMSERTLRRRLADEGESFRDTLKRVRRATCEIYLSDGNRTMSEIAHLLGYSEHSAFNRAFRDWFGMTPTQYLGQSTS